MEAVEAGVDVFESSYAFLAAENGRAVVFGGSMETEDPATSDCAECKDPWTFEIDLNNKKCGY